MKLKEIISNIPYLTCINPDRIEIYGEQTIRLITQSNQYVTSIDHHDNGGIILVQRNITIPYGDEVCFDEITIKRLLNSSLLAFVVNDRQPLDSLEKASFPVYRVSKSTTTTDGIFGQLCILYYSNPRQYFSQMIGVTGTNGKTTVTHMIEKVLVDSHMSVGLIGTLGQRSHTNNDKGNWNSYVDTHCTTPNAWFLQLILNKMKNEDRIDHIIMEVSSHGLSLERVHGCDFTVAIMTNVTQDHLGFHKTMSNYLQSKLLLFEKYLRKNSTAIAIVNHDDPFYEHFIKVCRSNVHIFTYGLSKKQENCFIAQDIQTSFDGTSYTVLLPSGLERRIRLRVHGNYNVYNSLACFAACATTYSNILTIDQIIKSLESFSAVKGRFQFQICRKPFSVVIDFAHTPDGLEQVLKCARDILNSLKENGRLIVLFGSSGRGDRTKRAILGSIAFRLADIVIVTSDNPFQEDPQKIIDDILTGMSRQSIEHQLFTNVDRKEAIHLALELARDRPDLVLITGKGHETQQVLADGVIEFNEERIFQEKYLEMKTCC